MKLRKPLLTAGSAQILVSISFVTMRVKKAPQNER
jgi:hypothetical protein